MFDASVHDSGAYDMLSNYEDNTIYCKNVISDIMELSDEMLTEISYAKISKYRTKVVKALDGETKIPTQIAKDSDIRSNHISKVLAELKSHELVECINPEARKGRLYRLTDKGDVILNNLEKHI